MEHKEIAKYCLTIFNFITEAIFIHDVNDLKIIEVNDAMLNMYGYDDLDDVLQGDQIKLCANIAPYNEEYANNLIQKAISEGPQKFDWLARRKDGSTFWIEMSLKRIDIGGIHRILAVGRDISEQKQTEMLLAEHARELKEINATKDKFLSIIAHDLKNPFNAIIGFSDLMTQNFYELDDETLLQGLNTIETASKHAYKLLENLLVWSQSQTGRSPFNPEILNLNTQVNESFKMIESSAAIKGIRVVNSVKKSVEIFADKNMLDAILRNLILNAIKFSYKGGKVKITAIEGNHEVQVSVSDNGVGISPENQIAIFRIDKHTITSGTDNEQGTGLGLLLCKDFTERHKGSIWVESTPGSGSTFTFSLPGNELIQNG